MFLRTLMIIILTAELAVSADWRWANDTSEFTMDKEAHFVGSAGAYFFFRHKDYSEKESILYSFYLGLGKEIIDAYFPHEKYGRWGGDGFSKYDLAYDIAGILCAWGIDKLWKPKQKENSKWERRFTTDSISFHYRFD